jgi:hypothetical protein
VGAEVSIPIVLPIKPKAISRKDRRALEAIGVTVIEMADPSAFRLITPLSAFDRSDAVTAVLRMACSDIFVKGKVGEILSKQLLESLGDQP